MLQIKTLGIFDSGLGGFSVYQDLKTQFPDLDMVMFADQGNAPYGNRSSEDILSIAYQAMLGFQHRGIASVLIACNTVSGVALGYLRDQFPMMNIWGIIDLTVSQVKDHQSVQVVATQATVNSNAYQNALPNHDVKSCALPQLVSLIEALADEALLLGEIDKCSYNADVLILGCTHYPLVKSLFQKCTDGIIFDSILPIRSFVDKLYLPSTGATEVYTSGDIACFKKQIKTLFDSQEEVRTWNSSL